MMKKEYIRVALADLIPYENNPRHNESAIDAVIASIQQCGNCDPIEIDEDNIILSGHTRRAALLKMGYDETDVIRISGMTDLQKRKYRLLANKTNELAEWDIEKLDMELDGLDFDGFDFGFDSEPVPDDLDSDESYSNDEKVSVKITFDTFKQYQTYEKEIKDIAERAGAQYAVQNHD